MTEQSLFEKSEEQYGVKRTRIRMHYPYLLDFSFDWRKENAGKFKPDALKTLLRFYCETYLNRYQKEGRDMEKLMKRITEGGFDEREYPDGLFGISQIDGLSNPKSWSQWNTSHVYVGLSKASLQLLRFGDCLGIRPTAVGRSTDELHEESFRILDQVMEGGHSYLRPFFRRIVIESRSFGGTFDVNGELAEIKRYIPSIHWLDSGAVSDVIAEALIEDFVDSHKSMDCGVKVGEYFDLPIFAKILWKSDNGQLGDPVRRRGVVELKEGMEIHFHPNVGRDFTLAYFVQTAIGEKYRFGNEIDQNIDYKTEQAVMENASRVLHNGLVEREYQNTVANNPHWVRMRSKSE